MKRSLLLVGVIAPLVIPLVAQARITKIQINTTLSESPTFGGFSWPGVGQYEKIVGKGFGEVNPNDSKNAVIVDLGLAPRNRNGNVEYSFDFYILKPIDLSKGAHKVMYEPPNRGTKLWSTFGRVPGGNDPGSITDPVVLANAFLMPRGFTMVWSGWDKAAGTSSANFNTTITLPIAKNPDGSSITGPSFEYIVTAGAASFTLSYPAATLDKIKTKLTHRVHLDDAPVVVPATGWAYNATGTSIHLVSSTGATASFVANDIYEFSYTAKDPTVNTVGLAAIRDWNAWLRYERRDDVGTPNPLAGDVTRIYTETVSQPARTLNDFTHLGFNQAENGKIVIDGMMQWIGAGDGLSMNYRFSQPGRTERNRQDHLFSEAVFPFANVMTADPFTGKRDSRYAKCSSSNTCPLARGSCQQFQNPLNSAPVQRALFIALDEWATRDKRPPRSRVPRLSDKTLVPPLPQSAMGFPNIPDPFRAGFNVTYTGLKTTRYRFDFGPDFYATGIATINPPVITPPYEDNPANGPIYPSFIPKTDSDGNDIAGVRLADVTVPLATYTGWALRAGPQANDGCESSGQYIAFARTKAERMTSGDPRPSVEERYESLDDYTREAAHALQKMVEQRLLLCEDFDVELNRLVAAGAAAGLQSSPQDDEQPEAPPACRARDSDDDDDD